jgi:anti-sigma factor RsiW
MTDLPATTADDELFFRAVCYVENELSDAERQHFEDQLATDVSACAAAAEAVRLISGLHAVQLTSPISGTHSPDRSAASRRRGAKGAVALSAALLLVTGVLVTFWRPAAPERMEVASGELLSRWRHDVHLGTTDDLEWSDDDVNEVEIMDESLSAPNWLISAVRLTVKTDPESP